MEKSRNLIKTTKRKFVIFSVVGISLLILVSLLSLSYYNQIVKKQESIQDLYLNIGKHLELVNKIGNLSDNFDDYPTQNTLNAIKPDFLNYIKELKTYNQKLNILAENNKYFERIKLDEVFDNKNLSTILNEYFNRAEYLLTSKGDNLTNVRKNLKYLTRISRTKLLEIFNYISKKVYVEQQKSLVQLNRVGTMFAALCIMQVVFIWLLIFRPLYKAIVDQNENLVEAILKSRSASRSKTDFLANISHEIRTPMTAILGYAELLKLNEGSEKEQEKSIQIINENAKHLLSLVDEILDISKIEAGKFDCEVETINLSLVLEQVYKLIKVKAELKGIDFSITNSGFIPEFIDSDSKRLKQILINLIGNAIKFTEVGSVTVNVSYNKDINKVVFKIIDTGIGIDKNSVSTLFKPFAQADSSVNRENGGTGLGLVLSRGLAKAMGGNIKILETKKGKGTTFVFTLEAGKAAGRKLISSFKSKKTKSKTNEDKAKVLLNKKVLVVDDAIENARLFSIYLSSAGANVKVANGGFEAIDFVKNNDFDMILLDLQMPNIDGYQTIAKIREGGFDKPIVALTAHAMPEEKVKTKNAGFNGHVTKPVTSDFLINSVLEHVNS